jgi:hypothetical protein
LRPALGFSFLGTISYIILSHCTSQQILACVLTKGMANECEKWPMGA